MILGTSRLPSPDQVRRGLVVLLSLILSVGMAPRGAPPLPVGAVKLAGLPSFFQSSSRICGKAQQPGHSQDSPYGAEQHCLLCLLHLLQVLAPQMGLRVWQNSAWSQVVYAGIIVRQAACRGSWVPRAPPVFTSL